MGELDSIEQGKGTIKIYIFVKMKFTCLNNRILVEPEKGEKQTISGIILPNEEKPITGIVIVGNKEVKKGDKIIFSKFGYDEVKIDGKLYYIVSDHCILGIFK